MWKKLGNLQLEFYKRYELKLNYSVLDIGCGCLWGGIPLIKYLDTGQYNGIGINQSLLEVEQHELEQVVLEYKKHFVCRMST